MKSRYGALHTIGTISVILAWVLLVLGVIAAISAWLGLRGLLNTLEVSAGIVPLTAALPPLLLGIIGFLQFYVLGKVLHLLVDLDDRTVGMTADLKKAQSGDAAEEISGELKRQATLIASTLESTQQIKEQVAGIEARLAPPPLVEAPQDVDEDGADEDSGDDGDEGEGGE